MRLEGPARVAAHRIAEAVRASGYRVAEPLEPAPLPPLSPDAREAALGVAMLVQQARRSPGDAPRVVASIIAWAAGALPPWEAGRAASASLPPARPARPPGLRGLLAAVRAYARGPTLEGAYRLALAVAAEAGRPCRPPGGPPPRRPNLALLALAVVAASLVASLVLDPVTSALVSIAIASLAALAAAAHGGAWRLYEYKWETCTLTRAELAAALPL